MSRIVYASAALLTYELLAMKTRRRTWTDFARERHPGSAVIWCYWLWLGLHLLTGGRL